MTPVTTERIGRGGAGVAFGQATSSVAFDTDVPAALAAAYDTLYAYRRTSTSTARWRLAVWGDATACPPPGVPATATLDIGPGVRASTASDGDERLFWIPDLRTAIRVDDALRHVTVRCPPQEAPCWATSLVRQLITAQMLADGAVYAHAAAFLHRGRGVLVVGHKNHGKTTTLLTALRHLRADYVTNDRLLLRQAPGGVLWGYPWPMGLRAGVGTLAALPHLAHLVPEALRGLSLAQRREYPDKILVEPPDFPELLTDAGTVATELHPDVLVWPTLRRGAQESTVEPLPAAEALDALLRTRLFMADPDRGYLARVNHWLVPVPAAEDLEVSTIRIAQTLGSLPRYRLHVGEDTAALGTTLHTLLGSDRR